MHIAYLVQQFPPEVGAGPARVAEMAQRWIDAGAQVTVITGMPNRPQGVIPPEYRGKLFAEEEWRGIRVLRSWLYASPKHGFARTLLNNLSFMTTAVGSALARAGRPDVLIASSPPFFPHFSGALVSRFRGVPLVLEVRDLWPDYLVGMGVLREGAVTTRALFGLERALLRRASHTVVVTESFRERIAEKGVPRERIDVIPNGVDTGQYFASDEPAPFPSLRREGRETVVGYLGNFGAGQGLTSVIEAAALLAKQTPKVRFVLAGDGPERRMVTQAAEERGLGNVSIHPPIPKDQTRAFYNACDVCLVPLAPIPIFQETIPSKIFEVMACERPLVASLSGEAARLVERSGCGLVTPPGDPEALAGAILRIRDTAADELRAMGASGRRFVQEHFDREQLAERYLDILRGVAGVRPASAPSAPVPT